MASAPSIFRGQPRKEVAEFDAWPATSGARERDINGILGHPDNANPIDPRSVSTPAAKATPPDCKRTQNSNRPATRLFDVAEAIAWLISDAADYVTGATLFIDEGMTRFPGFATGA
jgi:NAD(P)-dependent dehydrogenase (short-subunit alcohol dehydrogenase family)